MSKTYSWVVLDGPIPTRWEEDTDEGHEAAIQYCRYCRRNYEGYFSVRRLADKDTLGTVEKLMSDVNLAKAVRSIK